MLEARTVAVVGASPRAGSFGQQLLGEIRRGDPGIRVLPVNPRYTSVDGLPCVPTLADLDDPLDLVLLGVPNAALEEQLGLAAEVGARSAVVYASGYEPPEVGRPSLLDRMSGLARGAGMAVCGGNCMGFWNLDRGVRALGFQERAVPPRGPVTFVSHSGSAFSALLRNTRGLGFNLVVSSGQELVTSADAYVAYALEQDTTRVVALLLETARDPAGLRAALAVAAERDVPVVALKVGRSDRGRAMVAAHSGALAGEDAAYDALFEAYGVLRVGDLDELCDTVELVAAGRRAAPGALATVHDSGAERALAVDVAEAVGAPFAALQPATVDRLADLLDPGLEATNPLDVWGTGADTHTLFASALAAMADDPGVAAVALAVDLVHEYDGDRAYLTSVVEAAARTAKPVAVLSNAHSALDAEAAGWLRGQAIPVLEGTRTGLLALRHLLELRDSVSRPSVPSPPVDEGRRARWRSRLAQTTLSSAEALELLADYGVAVVPTRRASSADEAAAAAANLGYPVVLKTDQPEVQHKTEAQGVVLAVPDEDALRAAYDGLARRLGPRVAVSALAHPGVEMALGVVVDPQLGPLVVVAAGGVLVEVLADRVLAVPPLDLPRAAALVDRLRVRRLLDGVRGGPPGDLDAVAAAVVAVSVLAAELGPWLAAVDVNPLLCGPKGAVAVDGLVLPATMSRGPEAGPG
jgi:acyl-CoA synthetase (NDP forming)